MRTSSRLRLALPLTLAALAGLVAIVPSPARAQAGAGERTLFVSAVDGKGAPLEGLGPGDFVVREDGVRREVLRVSHAIEPIDIALLVDNSASSIDLIPRVREGLQRFIAAMLPGNSMALIGLADRPTILVDYTSDPTRLTAGLGRLFTQSSSGMTLLDAIVEVSQGLARRDTPRAVIVPVITDGTEFTNRHYTDVIATMTRAGAALHSITVGTFPMGGDDAARDRAYVVDQGASRTGGQRISLLTATAIEQALVRLASELQSQYKVVYSRPESIIPPEKVEVRAARPGVTMRGTPIRGARPGA